MTLNRMMNQEIGLAAREPIFSLSAARAWLDKNLPERPQPSKPERFPPKEENLSDEERKHRADMLHKTASVIRQTVRAKCVGRPLAAKQSNDHAARMRAMDNLEEMKAQGNEIG